MPRHTPCSETSPYRSQIPDPPHFLQQDLCLLCPKMDVTQHSLYFSLSVIHSAISFHSRCRFLLTCQGYFPPLIRSALPWLPQICPGQALHAGPSLSPQAQRVQDDACVDKPSRLPSMGNGEIYGGEKKIENRKIQEFDASHRLCRWCQKFPVWVQRTIVSFRLELCLSRVNSFKVRLQ